MTARIVEDGGGSRGSKARARRPAELGKPAYAELTSALSLFRWLLCLVVLRRRTWILALGTDWVLGAGAEKTAVWWSKWSFGLQGKLVPLVIGRQGLACSAKVRRMTVRASLLDADAEGQVNSEASLTLKRHR